MVFIPLIRSTRNSSYAYRGLIILLAITLLFCFYHPFVPQFNNGNWTNETNENVERDNSSLDCGHLIRSSSIGRLGNQMFMYASFYGMVRKQRAGKKAFVEVDYVPSMLDDAFEGLSIPRGAIADAGIERNDVQYVDEHSGCCTYEPVGIEALACDGKNVFIGGWRQSYKYFHHVMDEVKREFTFHTKIREQSHRLLEDSLGVHGLLRNECVIVGVHLRRGDFASSYEMSVGRVPASEQYLGEAIRFYESQFNSQECLVFLVFGDDHEWNAQACKNVVLLRPNSTLVIPLDYSTSTAAVDLCTISLCDHVIITTGTYSWWAGFFSPGMVVRQKEYVRNGSVHAREYKTEDHFPPDWIPL